MIFLAVLIIIEIVADVCVKYYGTTLGVAALFLLL